MMKKVLLGMAAVLVLAIVVLGALIALRWDRRFQAPHPAVTAVTDSAVIAGGRYFAYGPGQCAECHSAPEDSVALRNGGMPPLAGGRSFRIPPGTFRVPNLTPDSATGIGRRTDGELARMLRYGVRADGRAAVPFMNFHDLSDADLVAVISFLRAQRPVHHLVPDHDLNVLGKAVMAFLIKPIGPTKPPAPESPPARPTVERGAYLVTAVADCAGCHSQRSMVDGSFTGPPLAGGSPMETTGVPAIKVVPPNLTPDPKTGRITAWSEQDFVARFRAGERIPGSPMPWRAFGRMTDDDLRAVYRYLRSLPAVQR